MKGKSIGRGRCCPRQPCLAKGRGFTHAPRDSRSDVSALAQFLIKEWAWGKMSPQMVQTISHLALLDLKAASAGNTNSELEKLSRIGAHGFYSNNCHRDLKGLLPQSRLPQPHEFKLTCRTHVFGTFRMHDFSMLLPHEWFSAMHQHYPEYFRQHVVRSRDDSREFWSECGEHPTLRENVVKTISDYNSHVVPLSLHGDGVPVKSVGKSWNESVNVYSWASIVADTGTTAQSNFLIFGIFAHLVSSWRQRFTMLRFWKLLVWSFTALYEGVWPTVDMDGVAINSTEAGKPLAGGYRAILFLLKGDLEYLANARGNQTHPSHTATEQAPVQPPHTGGAVLAHRTV